MLQKALLLMDVVILVSRLNGETFICKLPSEKYFFPRNIHYHIADLIELIFFTDSHFFSQENKHERG